MIPTVPTLQELLIKQILSILDTSKLSKNGLPESRIIKVNSLEMIDELQFAISLDKLTQRDVRKYYCSQICTFLEESSDEASSYDRFIKRYDPIQNFLTKDFNGKSLQHTSTLDYASMMLGYAGWGGAMLGVQFTDLIAGYTFPYDLIDEVNFTSK